MTTATYEKAKEVQAKCIIDHDTATAHLIAVSGDKKGPLGMTPDHIKSTHEWRAAFKAERVAFAQLRSINGFVAKNFKKEERAARLNARK